jgi:hypothetical protein
MISPKVKCMGRFEVQKATGKLEIFQCEKSTYMLQMLRSLRMIL